MGRRIGFAGLFAAAVALTGCSADVRPPAAPRPIEASKASVKELRDHVGATAAIAAANAGHKMLAGPEDDAKVIVIRPVPPTPPVPVPVIAAPPTPAPPRPAAVSVHARSRGPHPSKQAAEQDALSAARVELMKQLQALDPPVFASPSLATVRSEFLKKDSVKAVPVSEADQDQFRERGLNPNQVYVELDLELTDAQLRHFRSADRVAVGLRGAAVLFAVFLAAHGFLRLDAWTKGYLTTWLAVGAGVVVLIAGLTFLT